MARGTMSDAYGSQLNPKDRKTDAFSDEIPTGKFIELAMKAAEI